MRLRRNVKVKNIPWLGLIALVAVLAAAGLLALVLCGIFNMEPSAIVQKMNSDKLLYIFPVLIVCDVHFFINDFLVYLSRKRPLRFGFDFSEIPVRYELNNSLIPLRSKLNHLYPVSIVLLLLGFAAVLFSR
jgi:hypothetical protein